MKQLFRLLLLLYPRDFRQRYGDGLLETWLLRRREARRRVGPLGLAWFHIRELTGAAVGAVRHRTESFFAGGNGSWNDRLLRAVSPGSWLRELRYASRRLLRSPGFTTASVLTLALAIGANTAIYSFVKGVVLDPLPYPDSERVVWIDHAAPGIGAEDGGLYMTRGLFHFYRQNARTLDEVAIYRTFQSSLTGDGSDPASVESLWTTWTLFSVLGVDAALGRLFRNPEGSPGETRVAVLTDEFWQTRYGGDPDVLGRTVRLDGTPYEIVGVLPPGAGYPDPGTQVILPRRVRPMSEGLGGWVERGIGRMAPAASPDQVERELRALVPRIPEAFGGRDFARMSVEEARIDPRISSLKAQVVGEVENTLWILMGSVGIVLLVALANLANLFLVRANVRQREVAVRRAVGGGRNALARLFLAEAGLLALLGGALGFGLAVAGLDAVVALAPPELPRLHEVGIDGTVLAFAAVITLGSALVFGSFPLFGRTGSMATILREGGRGSTERTGRTRRVLVAAQVALALVLVVGSGLTIQSFANLRSQDSGFRAVNTLTFQVGLSPTRYGSEREQAIFHTTLLQRLRGLPGVERVGAVGCLPLRDCSSGDPLYRAEETYDPDEIPPIVRYTTATAGYFEAMGIAVVEGRPLEARDHQGDGRAVVVSRALAHRFWFGESALGKRVRTGVSRSEGEPLWYEVVGVVEDVRSEGLTEPPTEIVYYPMVDGNDDTRPQALYYAVESGLPPETLVPSVRRELAELDASIPLARVAPMTSILDRAWAPARFTMALLVMAGAVALVLGLVGIYGVVSYLVSLRRPEIGLRIALGADAGQVRNMVLRQGVMMAVAGILVGLAGALGLSRLLDAELFGVGGSDPGTYAGAALLMLAVSAAAAWLPARGATRTEPMEVLRSE